MIGHELAAWASVDPPSLHFTSCDVFPGGSPESEKVLFEIEFADTDPGSILDLHRQGLAAALREYAPEPTQVERYRRIIAPNGVRASLVAAARAGQVAHVTVAGGDGPVGFHAAPANGAEGQVGVIVERPRPAELTPVILSAYDLTARETDVVAGVLRGESSRQVSRALGISEHPVSDHLKAIYRKVGVASRTELIAEVYVRFYLSQTQVGATPSPYGWYLDGTTGRWQPGGAARRTPSASRPQLLGIPPAPAVAEAGHDRPDHRRQP